MLTEETTQQTAAPDAPGKSRARLMSQDAYGNAPRQYLIHVEATRKQLLAREDTNADGQITVEDLGPKDFLVHTAASGGSKSVSIRGTYMVSNLLQELTLATHSGLEVILLDENRLNENPVNRMTRLIKHHFWPNLTRRIDGSNIFQVANDPKDWTAAPRPRIYIPVGAPEQYEYYKRIASEHPDLNLDVQFLSETPGDAEYVRDLNEAPGLLAIEMERIEDTPNGESNFRGLPFVVPGGRFNELYGWDSYMETLGLLINDRIDLCEAMVRHFCFSIKHYGKILNANRSYYLCRSQPPFLTDMALRTYERLGQTPESLEFLRNATLAAIKDYYATWMSAPRFDAESGLSRYYAGGIGVPPETEASHFVKILEPFSAKHGLSIKDFVHSYNYGHIYEPHLDEWFKHDRSVRESGHDTSYRLENVCADIATVDLNSLLYKYEVDIARTIRERFGDRLEIPPEWQAKGKPSVESSSSWDRRARKRRKIMESLMWDQQKGMYIDYDTVKRKQTGYESATTFWAMWAGVATPDQAATMVKKALPRFEEHGGLASGTEQSRGAISVQRPNRQWDYPFGWAPQQILAWTGFERYGYHDVAQRLAYRWLLMVTRAFVDYNGVVVEKYDVTKKTNSHKVTAEYGNQGADFKGAATEGFGWVNASYVYGLNIIDARMRRALGAVTEWDTYQRMTEAADAGGMVNVLDHADSHDRGHEIEAVEGRVAAPAGEIRLGEAHHENLPHSHEASTGHKAVHGNDGKTVHTEPDQVVHR